MNCETLYLCHILIVTCIDHFSPHNPHFNVVFFCWEFHLNLCKRSLTGTICTSKSVYSTGQLSCRGNGCFLFIMDNFLFVLIDLNVKTIIGRQGEAKLIHKKLPNAHPMFPKPL